MNTIIKIISIIYGIFLAFAGLNHFIKPQTYLPFLPDNLMRMPIIYLSGIIEILLGVGLFLPKYKYMVASSILLLMIIFLPLHVIDVFKENPAIGSKQLAYIRLPLQFVLIYLAWLIWKNSK